MSKQTCFKFIVSFLISHPDPHQDPTSLRCYLSKWTVQELDCKTVGFFLKISKEIGKAWRKSLARAKPASLFSTSFQTFCLTACPYLNTQKYGLFCSLSKNGYFYLVPRSPVDEAEGEIWASKKIRFFRLATDCENDASVVTCVHYGVSNLLIH